MLSNNLKVTELRSALSTCSLLVLKLMPRMPPLTSFCQKGEKMLPKVGRK
jgi:hypothetical protein